ncbi:MAG: uroporphyrinogen-III synthase, partial [Pseudomonadota bacterium]
WPLTRVEPIQATLPRPLQAEAVLATSAHGIRGFAALSERRDLPVFCVGDRTAEVARGLGFGLCLSASGRSADLIQLARQSGLRRFIYPRGRDVSVDLAQALEAAGHRVHQAVVYAAVPAGPPPAPVAAAFRAGEIPVVTVWSARNASVLARWLDDSGPFPLTSATLVAISRAASQPAENSGFGHISVAERSDAAGMLAAVRSALPAK